MADPKTDFDGHSNVIQFPDRGRGEVPLTKRQIAARFGRCERWVEMRQAEGMPAEYLGTERRYYWSQASEWVAAWTEAKKKQRKKK